MNVLDRIKSKLSNHNALEYSEMVFLIAEIHRLKAENERLFDDLRSQAVTIRQLQESIKSM